MRNPDARWNLLAVVLLLSTMLGCQSLNASKPSNQQPESGNLALSSGTLDFGTVAIGRNKTLPVTLVNGTTASVTLTKAAASGSGFSLSAPRLPVTIAAGQQSPLSFTFAPKNTGSNRATVSISTSLDAAPLTLEVSGDAVPPGQLTATPARVDFGQVTVGGKQTQPVTLTNTGGSTVNINQVTVTGSSFAASGLNLPLALEPGAHTSFNVTFSPQAAGNAAGNVAIASDVPSSPLNVPLDGTGISGGWLTADPASIDFGSVEVGKNQQQPETITNTGDSSVTITQANVSGASFSISGLSLPLTLGPGQGKPFTVTFAPSAGGAVNGNIRIVNDGSNPALDVPLSGTGLNPGFLSTDPPSIDFGTVTVGDNSVQSETVTNTGGVTLTVTQATVTGGKFSISGLSLPLTLTPGQRFTFGVTFAPSSRGSFSGNVALTSDASNSNATIVLWGRGKLQAQLNVSPPTQDFGDVTVGTNKDLVGTLTASNASVTVSSYSMDGSEFTLSGLSFPFTVAPNQNVQFTVTFSPQMSGQASSSLSFVSDAANSPTVQALTGNGIAPPQHSVDLTWNPSPSSGVVGYNVYRGGNSGGPYGRINSDLGASTAYTDDTVQSGQTYYYVTTAVDENGRESGYSNEAPAVIPNP